jgi:DNA-binding transcriptional ArsR family regulator
MNTFFAPASPHSIPISLASEPTYNALNSIALLNEVAHMPALASWVLRTASSLTPAQRRANLLIFVAFPGAVLPDRDWPTFPAYLDDLASQPAGTLRDRAIERMGAMPTDADALAAQVPQLIVDAALAADAYALLGDPPAMQDLIVTQLRTIWDTALADEWRRSLPPLQKLIAVARQRSEPEVALIAENLRTLIVRDAYDEPGVEQILCIPSPHTGHYITRLRQGATLRLFFHGPSSYPAVMRTSPLGRPELLARLAALADDTRLRILELFAQQHELSAPEIMARLDLSQPSVSRHLKQLAPFLFERRGDGASKIYSLGSGQFDQTFRTLGRTLSGAEAAQEQPYDARAGYPREPQRLLNKQGRLADWPAKRRDQVLLLDYVAVHFEPGRDYSEKEINAILIEHMDPVFKDYAIIRRALCDYRYLDRERDGSRYWRVERQAETGKEQPA